MHWSLDFHCRSKPYQFNSNVGYIQGYGANTFTWRRSDYSIYTTYRGTHGYHTGLDYGRKDDASLLVYAVCDGVILSGREPGGNGGSISANTGRGIALRCFQDDPPLSDPDHDGHRNLSNIVVTYNHIIDLPSGYFPQSGDMVREGDLLAQTTHYYSCSPESCERSNNGTTCTLNPNSGLQGTCDVDENGRVRDWKQDNHLHLEVFIARGFRDGIRLGEGDGKDAIRINPLLMFEITLADFHLDPSRIGPYYPYVTDYLYLGHVGLLETKPFDYEDSSIQQDDEGNTDERIDVDFGIQPDELGPFLPHAEVVRTEVTGTNYRGLFWTRANPTLPSPVVGVQLIDENNPGPEWTANTLVITQDLLWHLFLWEPTIYSQSQTYIGTAPYCSNVFMETGAMLPDEPCGDRSVEQDDADLNIPPN